MVTVEMYLLLQVGLQSLFLFPNQGGFFPGLVTAVQSDLHPVIVGTLQQTANVRI